MSRRQREWMAQKLATAPATVRLAGSLVPSAMKEGRKAAEQGLPRVSPYAGSPVLAVSDGLWLAGYDAVVKGDGA